MRYNYTHIGMIKSKKSNSAKFWCVYRVTGTLIYCWWKRKMIQPLWKTIWLFLTKLSIILPYDPVIVLISIYLPYSNENPCLHKHLHMNVYRFIRNFSNWKRPRCFSTDEYINKLWYLHTMEYYLLIKNKLLSHKNIQRNLKCILRGERNQSERSQSGRLYAVWFQLYDIIE